MDSSVTIVGSCILAVLLAGYFAQIYLPPPTPKIIGIDLGTTYSCVSVYEAVSGRVRVIPVDDKHDSIPSVVAFSTKGVKVGYDAENISNDDPFNTVYDAKRFIGKVFDPRELEILAKSYPFSIKEKNGLASFTIKHGSSYLDVNPETVSAHIVRFLKQVAETNLSVAISKAVMAVPAEFDELQRNLTRVAAKMAGIEVLRLINEPTAAALAYGLHKKEGIEMVMVIDIGGGTTDISILRVQHGMFFTQAIAGNNHLGGQDFTQSLTNDVVKVIEEKYKRKLVDTNDMHSLRKHMENAKLKLTTADWVTVSLPLKSMCNNCLPFTINVTRDRFEKLNYELFEKVVSVMNVVLGEADVDVADVDEIVLVGGSTRIPMIRQIIRDRFSKELNTEVDPELAVAYGVAIQAGILGGMWPLQVSALEIPSRISKLNVS